MIPHRDDDDLDAFTDEELADICRVEKENLVWSNQIGVQVLRFSSKVVIKFGFDLSRHQAENQEYVYNHVDHDVLRVPKVLRFFNHTSDPWPYHRSYFAMEYIEGTPLSETAVAGQPELIDRIATAMKALSQIPVPQNVTPGPLGDGEPRGYMWGDFGAGTSFRSITEMEHWINIRIKFALKMNGRKHIDPIDLSSVELVMCHMDVAPRNIIVTTDGTICFVDWDFADFYPWFFQEHQLYDRALWDRYLYQPLLEKCALPPSVTQDQVQLRQLGYAQGTAIRTDPSCFP
jgi:aminoglycoside phosphotransferase (APT) family kinase protein